MGLARSLHVFRIVFTRGRMKRGFSRRSRPLGAPEELLGQVLRLKNEVECRPIVAHDSSEFTKNHALTARQYQRESSGMQSTLMHCTRRRLSHVLSVKRLSGLRCDDRLAKGVRGVGCVALELLGFRQWKKPSIHMTLPSLTVLASTCAAYVAPHDEFDTVDDEEASVGILGMIPVFATGQTEGVPQGVTASITPRSLVVFRAHWSKPESIYYNGCFVLFYVEVISMALCDVGASQQDGGQTEAAGGDKRQRGWYAPSAPPSLDGLSHAPSSPPLPFEAASSPVPSAPLSLEEALLATEGSRGGERGSAAPRPVPLASSAPLPSAPAASPPRSPSAAPSLPRPSTTISIPRPSTTSPSRPSAAPIPRPQITTATTRHAAAARPTAAPSAATSPARSARLASSPPPPPPSATATDGSSANARRGQNQRRRQRRRGDTNNNNNNSAATTTDRAAAAATAGTTTTATANNDARTRNNNNNNNNNNNTANNNNNNVRGSPRRNAYAGSSSGAGLEAERLRVQGGTWTHSHSGLMSSLAVTVTTFNISRFAVLGARFGWPFVVQWGVVSLVLGLPLMTFHMTVGQYLGAGVVDMWRISPIFQGVGYSLALAQALLGVYCCVPIAWLFIYFRDSFITSNNMFRWADCRFNCSAFENLSAVIIEGVPKYFNAQVLQRSDGESTWLQDLGSLKFDLAFNIALLWIITLIALSRGNQSYGKVCYIIFLLPLLCYLVACLYLASWTKDDLYMNVTNFNDLFANSRSWMAASREVFLVWGLHGAVLQQMSAHNKRGHALYRDTTIVCLITTLTLVLAAVTGLSCVSGLQHKSHLYYKPSSFERTESAKFLSDSPFRHPVLQEPFSHLRKTNAPQSMPVDRMHHDNFYAGIRIRAPRSMSGEEGKKTECKRKQWNPE
ncbi:uncharacterized protein LOC122250686 [Penaeus japonicus]|uniref:uncharacterized protein LOC122250686 n=1 Tax=Penaeus japonicus TaxID=27405 RepID=UPI001C714501|nr:uncharacterized protein LOC122250686 [Penaeus japonicus]